MQLFYQPDLKPNGNALSIDDSKHASRVLRMQPGEEIQVTNGKGQIYQCRLTTFSEGQYGFETMALMMDAVRSHHITIAIAPTKNSDRTEWFVEKAVEIGIDRIVLLQCKHSERTTFKVDRAHKIAVSAMKQSGQGHLPEIVGPVPFATAITQYASRQNFVATVPADPGDLLLNRALPRSSYCVMIGPEGDFTPAELSAANEAGYKTVSLGPHRLRTETAALAACHILNLVQQLQP